MYLKEVIQKTKKSGSRKYLQFVESIRTEKGPRQSILVNVGRVDDKPGKKKLELLAQSLVKLAETLHLIDIEKDIEGESSKDLGCEMVFRRLFKDVGLDRALEKTNENTKTEFYTQDALFNLVLNRVSAPCSKNAVVDWQEDQHQLNHYDTHQYYRAMDSLHDNKEDIEVSIFSEMKAQSKSRDQNLNVALFDTTSVVYYGEGDEEESLLNYGFSKDKRSDLKQIVVGVAMTKDGIPLSHETFAGNINDLSCFEAMIKKFRKTHSQRQVTFVGDRGLISNKNVELLVSSGYQYLLGFKMRTITKKERADILKKTNLYHLKKDLEFKDLDYKDQRLIVYYNEERAEKDRLKREEILDRLRHKIKSGDIKSLVSSKDKKFLKIEGKSPKLDLQKIEGDAAFDGVFILTTNAPMKAMEAITTYRDLWQCESGFRTLKSEIELQPLFHRKERRIRSHVFICFLALICKTLLNKALREEDKNSSYSKTLRDLQRLRVMTFKIRKTRVSVRTSIGNHAKTAFKALKMAFPKKVLSYENENLLVLPK